MALDKQRILNELGSVMNQLQSADCGCMGKLFNSGQDNAPMGNPLPTCTGCRHGCCRGHGYGVHYNNGDTSMSGGGMCRNVMGMGAGGGMGMGAGGCMAGNGAVNQGSMGMNPGGMPMGGGTAGGMGMPNNSYRMMNSLKDTAPRLYNETYNYLNQNLMRPVVNEVFQDLKSLSPGNAMGNSPLAQQIPALSGAGQNPALSGVGGTDRSQNQGMLTGAMGNIPMDSNAASGNPMKSMGNQILNMMMSRSKPHAGVMPIAGGMHGGQVSGEGIPADAPQTSDGQVGMTPVSPSMGANANNPEANMGFGNLQMANPTTQYVTQDNMYSLPPEANVNNAQGNIMHGNMAPNTNNMAPNINNIAPNMNPGTQNSIPAAVTGQNKAGLINSRPGGVSLSGPNNYGQHSMGMRTFQKMFPGIAEGDELGFDPMAIAIQMNPANQQRAAMDTMNKIMNNQPRIRSNIMQPVIQGTNAISSQLAQQQNPGQINAPAGQQNLTTNQQPIQNDQQQLSPTGQVGGPQIVQGQQQAGNPGGLVPHNQQIYTAVTGTPTMNQPIQQQQIQGQVQPQQGQMQQQQLQGQTEYQQGQNPGQANYQQHGQGQIPQQQMIDPATGAPLNHTAGGDPNAQMQNQGMTKEPLHPADTSRNTVPYGQPVYKVHYNTLGQPVNLENPDNYYIPIPPLPQTLSPQDPQAYKLESSVKNTMSKTSLAANRVIGQTPSKSQLRHIYRQYKAGHAGMQQSIRPPQGGSQSDGKLYPPGGANAQGQAHVEKVGGDTIQNVNTVQPVSVNPGQNIGQLGDVNQINKPQTDIIADKAPMMQSNRNGLQDMRFTKYIETNGWSFHGDYSGIPTYNYRSRRPA